MSRKPRHVVPGMPLHIIQRGNNRANLLLDTQDFSAVTEMLLNSSTKYSCKIHAYVLMNNHMHILATPSHEAAPARMMQSVGLRFVRYFNHRYGRSGTAWEGRYKSSVVKSRRYFFACTRYIEMNPVRALMVDEPAAYQWSSFRHNALGVADGLVTEHELYRSLGHNATERQSAYGQLFESYLEPALLSHIRKATQSGEALSDFEAEGLSSDPSVSAPALTPLSALQL